MYFTKNPNHAVNNHVVNNIEIGHACRNKFHKHIIDSPMLMVQNPHVLSLSLMVVRMCESLATFCGVSSDRKELSSCACMHAGQ